MLLAVWGLSQVGVKHKQQMFEESEVGLEILLKRIRNDKQKDTGECLDLAQGHLCEGRHSTRQCGFLQLKSGNKHGKIKKTGVTEPRLEMGVGGDSGTEERGSFRRALDFVGSHQVCRGGGVNTGRKKQKDREKSQNGGIEEHSESPRSKFPFFLRPASTELAKETC